MKKKMTTLMLALFAIVTTARAQVQINATNFPDANFRNWLLAQDYGKDSKLTTAEIKAVTVIDVYKKSIANLKGIEHFTALTQLRCYDNQLTALDVSKNTKLTLLYCSDNQLTTLNVPKNTALVTLYCQNNKLTALDVSKNTALTQLWCYGNQIKGNNMLTLVNSLPKVSGNFYVINTAGSNAQNVITEAQVKIAKNKGWKVYDYNGGNKKEYAGSDAGIVINSTNFPDANFRSFLLAQNYGADAILTPAEIEVVTKMNVYGKSIANLKGIEHFTALTKLYCQNNKLTALDVSKNTALTVLDCSGNKLTALNMSKNAALTALRCAVNQIKGDNMLVLVNSLPMVKSGEFYVINTRNTSEGNVIMKTLVITAKNKGWKVYDENGGSSKEYAGSGSGIAINATNFPDANFRGYVAGTTIDKDKDGYLSDEEIAKVTEIDVNEKGIKNLKGIEHFTALKELYCHDNQLTALDVSKNTALEKLNCRGNQLTALDVSKNTALTWLSCGVNKLSPLNVSNNTALEELYCRDNQLTALDVSKNTKLTTLSCFGNRIKGEKMLALVNSLPKVGGGKFYAVNLINNNEQNVITQSQVALAQSKGWTTYDWNSTTNTSNRKEYAGVADGNGIVINATNFPDANFRNWLLEQSYGKDALLTTSEISRVTDMRVNGKSIKSLKGIEHFTALKILLCHDNQLTALDFSKNTKLNIVYCFGNQIKDDMLALVNSLPKTTGGRLYAIDTKNSSEQNVITKSQVKIAKDKGWTTYDNNGGQNSERVYAGSDDPTGIAVNATNFPDANFRNWLLAQSYGKDAILTAEEIASVTEIRVSGKDIKNLKGIEHFTALTLLNCEYNQLTTLDVSKNTKLEKLGCLNNQLSTLNVSKNIALDWLGCGGNKLSTLDVSKNTALEMLWCSDNQLTALDVSKNTKLRALGCNGNRIKGEKMLALVNSLPKRTGEFYAVNFINNNEQNVITQSQVKIAKDKGWTTYDWNSTGTSASNSKVYEGVAEVSGIAINAANFPDANFRNWLLAQSYGKDALLTAEEIADETRIDVSGKGIKNLKGIEHFTTLQYLDCCNNQLTELDLSKLTNLRLLYIDGNQIKGDKMTALMNSLRTIPTSEKEKVEICVINSKNTKEQNVCTQAQVKIATGKRWKVYDWNGGNQTEYAGSGATPVEAIEADATPHNAAWYSLDGQKLQGEPTKPGIYIRNGRKVLKK